jgi:hypothetical protein
VNEQQLAELLINAELTLAEAKEELAKAKMVWLDAETEVVNARIARDRALENLRVFRNTDPNIPPDAREMEIQRFRKANPEVVEFAKERDLKLEEEEKK